MNWSLKGWFVTAFGEFSLIEDFVEEQVILDYAAIATATAIPLIA
jgi:hypothetical protein